MKLLLCSEAFRTSGTVQACVELCGKPQDQISIAIINEGYAIEDDDKRWVLHNFRDIANNFSGPIDMVNLLALPLETVESRIAKYDVIFVVGGGTDYLMHVFNKTGFSKLLPKLLQTKVYVGSSAGSMIMGRRTPSSAYHAIYGKSDTFGVQEYLGFVDLAIRAHLNNPEFPNNTPEGLKMASAGINFSVYGLQDDSALVIDGSTQTFVGSKPVMIVDGGIAA